MNEIRVEDITCSYCGDPEPGQKDEYNEACCDRCFDEHCQTSREIYQHEARLKQEGYYGYPELVPTPSTSEIKKGEVIRQRGEEFVAV